MSVKKALFAVAGGLATCAAQLAFAAPPTAGATKDTTASAAPAPTSKPGAATFGPGASFTIEAVPAVPPLESPEVNLAVIDLELLKKVKAARRLDRDPTSEPMSKADAWTLVADAQTNENPYKEAAVKRAATWRDVATARAKRKGAIETLRKTFLADRAKLASLQKDADEHRRAELETAFLAAYGPYENEIVTWADVKPTPTVAGKPVKKDVVSPIFDPLGTPVVHAQRFVLKGDFGAHVQSFSVDTSEDLLTTAFGRKPTYDLSGFYAGGQAAVNVAEQSDYAIGILAYGRFHVTTSLPETSFTSGDDDAATIAPPDGDRPGAFAVGAGGRFAGNLTDRIGMNLGLTAGYMQFLAPADVPGCGPNKVEWDPALRGFQGEIFVGAEFYPLSLLSFGVSGRVGFGHVQGEWCVPGSAIDPSATNPPDDQALDVSADSFSAGAQGEIGFHF
ncbi:MAG: hypothetical protein HOW73_21450 [Polyangiaceae bacterium]|nr:hypothetical protein [Polyangiaceae bacterium]